MATFDGQLKVVMSMQGSSMTTFDGQFKVVTLSLKSTKGTGSIMAGTAGSVQLEDLSPYLLCQLFQESSFYFPKKHGALGSGTPIRARCF